MTSTLDPSDTARLSLGAPAVDPRGPSPEDTADLGENFLRTPGDQAPPDVRLRRYAEAILRFYRARTILDRQSGDELTALAWSYLDGLEPAQVPAVARPAFFELAYFTQLQAQPDGFDHAGFRRRVNEVAVVIDGFLDDIFAGDPS